MARTISLPPQMSWPANAGHPGDVLLGRIERALQDLSEKFSELHEEIRDLSDRMELAEIEATIAERRLAGIADRLDRVHVRLESRRGISPGWPAFAGHDKRCV